MPNFRQKLALVGISNEVCLAVVKWVRWWKALARHENGVFGLDGADPPLQLFYTVGPPASLFRSPSSKCAPSYILTQLNRVPHLIDPAQQESIHQNNVVYYATVEMDFWLRSQWC